MRIHHDDVARPASARPAPASRQDSSAERGPAAGARIRPPGGGLPGLTGDLLLHLQRQYGNRHVQQVMAVSRGGGAVGEPPALQPKLAVGPPSDRYEREADLVARRVTRQAGSGRAQHQPQGSTRPVGVQRLRGGHGPGADATMERTVGQARSAAGGRAIPSRLRWQVEQELGADLSAVRVHTGQRADQLNEALRSHAFTVGRDVFVRQQAYRPGTQAGDALLAHELTHTVQQGASRPSHEAGSAPPTPAIQRLFGLELELPVLLTRGPDDKMRDPNPVDKVVVGRAANGTFKLHIDHSVHVSPLVRAQQKVKGEEALKFELTKSPAILELVTAPMQGPEDGQHDYNRAHVGQVMRDLVSIADQIQDQVISQGRRIPVASLPGVTVDGSQQGDMSNHVGIDTTAQGTGKAVKRAARRQSVDAYVQATYGIDLRRVPREFQLRADAPKAGPDKSMLPERLRSPLRAAHGDAMHMQGWLTQKISDHKAALPALAGLEGPENIRKVANMRGLFALIAYYLRMGRISIDDQVTGLLKKKLGTYFFKVKLSTMSERLMNGSNAIETLLNNDKIRREMIDEILGRTQRAGDERVLSDAPIRCERWLQEVLTGQDDKLFDAAKNPGADELSPGMVMENRRFAQTEGKANVQGKKKGRTRPGRFARTEWVGMAIKLYEHLRQLGEGG